MKLEEALEDCYYCRKNVAVAAKEVGVSTEELKRLLREYVINYPYGSDESTCLSSSA